MAEKLEGLTKKTLMDQLKEIHSLILKGTSSSEEADLPSQQEKILFCPHFMSSVQNPNVKVSELLLWLTVWRTGFEKCDHFQHIAEWKLKHLFNVLKCYLLSPDRYIVYETQRVYVAVLKKLELKFVLEDIATKLISASSETMESVCSYTEICRDLLSRHNPHALPYFDCFSKAFLNLLPILFENRVHPNFSSCLYQLILSHLKIVKLILIHQYENAAKFIIKVINIYGNKLLDLLFDCAIQRGLIWRKVCQLWFKILSLIDVRGFESRKGILRRCALCIVEKLFKFGIFMIYPDDVKLGQRSHPRFGFTGSEIRSQEVNIPDCVRLGEGCLLCLKACECLSLKPGDGQEAKSAQEKSLGVLQNLDVFLKENIPCDSKVPFHWLPQVFSEQDDFWIEAMLMLLNIAPLGSLPGIKDNICLCHHHYFHQFIASTGYDHGILVDLLTSPETCFLTYFTKYLKYCLKSWDEFVEAHSIQNEDNKGDENKEEEENYMELLDDYEIIDVGEKYTDGISKTVSVKERNNDTKSSLLSMYDKPKSEHLVSNSLFGNSTSFRSNGRKSPDHQLPLKTNNKKDPTVGMEKETSRENVPEENRKISFSVKTENTLDTVKPLNTVLDVTNGHWRGKSSDESSDSKQLINVSEMENIDIKHIKVENGGSILKSDGCLEDTSESTSLEVSGSCNRSVDQTESIEEHGLDHKLQLYKNEENKHVKVKDSEKIDSKNLDPVEPAVSKRPGSIIEGCNSKKCKSSHLVQYLESDKPDEMCNRAQSIEMVKLEKNRYHFNSTDICLLKNGDLVENVLSKNSFEFVEKDKADSSTVECLDDILGSVEFIEEDKREEDTGIEHESRDTELESTNLENKETTNSFSRDNMRSDNESDQYIEKEEMIDKTSFLSSELMDERDLDNLTFEVISKEQVPMVFQKDGSSETITVEHMDKELESVVFSEVDHQEAISSETRDNKKGSYTLDTDNKLNTVSQSITSENLDTISRHQLCKKTEIQETNSCKIKQEQLSNILFAEIKEESYENSGSELDSIEFIEETKSSVTVKLEEALNRVESVVVTETENVDAFGAEQVDFQIELLEHNVLEKERSSENSNKSFSSCLGINGDKVTRPTELKTEFKSKAFSCLNLISDTTCKGRKHSPGPNTLKCTNIESLRNDLQFENKSDSLAQIETTETENVESAEVYRELEDVEFLETNPQDAMVFNSVAYEIDDLENFNGFDNPKSVKHTKTSSLGLIMDLSSDSDCEKQETKERNTDSCGHEAVNSPNQITCDSGVVDYILSDEDEAMIVSMPNTAMDSEDPVESKESTERRKISEGLEKTMSVIIRVRMKIEKLKKAGILQYNPEPLLKLLNAVEELYESVS